MMWLARIISVFGLQKTPITCLQMPLHSWNVTVLYGFSAAFILGPFFFSELSVAGHVTRSVTGQRYASLLKQSASPAFQARRYVSTRMFMQDSSPPNITRYVKHVLRRHFCDDAIISRHLPTARLPRLPRL